MNDFTKEELEHLGNVVSDFINRNRDNEIRSILIPIFDKIEFMFENYFELACDHEFKLCRSFYGVDESRYRCTKCLKTYEEVNNE